jgi:hypothetical protein
MNRSGDLFVREETPQQVRFLTFNVLVPGAWLYWQAELSSTPPESRCNPRTTPRNDSVLPLEDRIVLGNVQNALDDAIEDRGREPRLLSIIFPLCVNMRSAASSDTAAAFPSSHPSSSGHLLAGFVCYHLNCVAPRAFLEPPACPPLRTVVLQPRPFWCRLLRRLFILLAPAFHRQTLSAGAVPRIALSVSSASITDLAFWPNDNFPRSRVFKGNGRLARQLEK